MKTKKSLPVVDESIPVHSTDTNGNLYEIDINAKTAKKVMEKAKEEPKFEELSNIRRIFDYLSEKFFEPFRMKRRRIYWREYCLYYNIDDVFVVENISNDSLELLCDGCLLDVINQLDVFVPAKIDKTANKKVVVKKQKENKEKIYKPKQETPEDKALRLLEDAKTDADPDFNFSKLVKSLGYTGKERKYANRLVESYAVRDIKYLELCDKLISLIIDGMPEEKDYTFVGTCLPAYKSVGRLDGGVIEVTGTDNICKWIDAVPFLRDYILYYEPKAMQQLMRYVTGQINEVYLLKNPYCNEKLPEYKSIEYKSKAFKNSPELAKTLTLYCESIGLVPPQDILYNSGLNIGDKIMLWDADKWVNKKVYDIENGCIIINRGFTITKQDKWTKV